MTNVEHAAEEASFQDVIRIDEEQVRSHVDQVVRRTVEETLNGLLDVEADDGTIPLRCGVQDGTRELSDETGAQRRAMVFDLRFVRRSGARSARRSPACRRATLRRRHSLDLADRRAVEGSAAIVPVVRDLLAPLRAVVERRRLGSRLAPIDSQARSSWRRRVGRRLRRRHVRRG